VLPPFLLEIGLKSLHAASFPEIFAKCPLLPNYCVRLKFWHGVTRSEALALIFSR